VKKSLFTLLLLAVPRLALADGDATQAIDSPIAPGSGITLTANQSQTALTFGMQQQFGKVWDWNAAIEGVVNDSDTVTVFSRSGGAGPGTTLRVGIGYSGARAKPTAQAIMRCDNLKTEYAKWNARNLAIANFDSCFANVAALRKQLKLSVVPKPGFDDTDAASACDAQVGSLVDDLGKVPEGQSNPLATKIRDALVAARKQRVEAQDSVDTGGIEIGLYGAPPHALQDQTFESCEDIARDVKALDPGAFDDRKREHYNAVYGLASQFESSDIGGPWLRVGLSGYLNVVGGKFHPIGADNMPDLSDQEPFVRVLPGLSLDGAIMFPDKIVALSVGTAGGIDDTSTKVCHHTVQGEYYVDDCSTDYIGRPERQWRGYASFLLSLSPFTTLGNFNFGMQLSVTILTSAGTSGGVAHDIFGSGSWRYKASLPLFLTTKNLPWGMAVGIAPEVTKTIDVDQDEDVRLLFFVGARPQSASQM
jgi:hypothetical protein